MIAVRRALLGFVGLGLIALGGAPGLAGAADGTYLFAPYIDLTQYPAPNLQAVVRAGRVRQMTLGFVTAASSRRCGATWGGYPTEPASGPHPYRRASVLAVSRSGGQTIASFGGEAGVELATVCPTPAVLETAYGGVISAYRAHRIDFDIEGAALGDRGANARRATAIAALQRTAAGSGHPLQVSFTLPILPTGLTGDALAVLRGAVAAGVHVATVNAMTMDYGDSAAPRPAGQMGRDAILAAGHLRAQLARLYPRRSARALMGMIGLTPMIGINDDPSEIFTLADATQLAAFARSAHIGLLSMWQLERDRACAQPTRFAQLACSGVAQTPWQFSHTLEP